MVLDGEWQRWPGWAGAARLRKNGHGFADRLAGGGVPKDAVWVSSRIRPIGF